MGQHVVLDALYIVDQQLALEAVVDNDAEVDQVKDDKAQDTERLQRVAPFTVGRGKTQTGRGGRERRKEGRWWSGLMRERKPLSCKAVDTPVSQLHELNSN